MGEFYINDTKKRAIYLQDQVDAMENAVKDCEEKVEKVSKEYAKNEYVKKSGRFYYDFLKKKFGNLIDEDRAAIKKVTIFAVTSAVIGVLALVLSLIGIMKKK